MEYELDYLTLIDSGFDDELITISRRDPWTDITGKYPCFIGKSAN